MTINIFGQKIKVLFSKTREELGLCGYYNNVKQEIIVDSTLDKKLQTETLLHECLHALAERLSYRQAIQEQLEETMSDQIAKMLVENFDIRLKK